jgi:predicted Zn-dependent peptidase
MCNQYQLKNRANVILVPQPDAQSVTILIMFPVGSRYENGREQGVSHFIEHMMFKGTKKRPSTLILTREIDRLGAEYNAFTGKESTGYYIKVDSKYTETALDILSDMLHNSLFKSEEMEKEKRVIVEEIRMYKDNPIMNIDNIFENLLFEGCQLGVDIAGSEKRVLGYERGDVLKYRDSYYRPDNMTIVVAGKVNADIKRILNRYFERRISDKCLTNIRQIFTPVKFGSVEKTKRLKIEEKKTDQTQLMLGFPGIHYTDRRNPVLSVMNMILGGSMSSRLFIQVRERRGLAYMVASGADNYHDTGHVYVRAGLEAKNLNQAIGVVKGEIEKIKNHGVTARELKDAKTHIRGALTLAMEDSSAQASWYARQALFMDEVLTPEERLKEVDKVTNAQIITLAKNIFDFDKMRVAIIGEVKKLDIRY